jgi:1-acyl-sn-glycerol-3-phosphate acyltransferase
MGLVYQVGYYASRALAHCCFDYRVIGREKIPREGGLLLAMNHQSFLDPPLAGIACEREIFYLARKSLLEWPVLGALFPAMNVIPYDQEGSDMSALKTVIRMVKEGHATVIFPEGTRSRDGNLQPAQSGLGMVVAKTLVPVVPLRIFGAFEAFPRGGKRLRWSPIRVVVGDVLRFATRDFEGPSKAAYARVSEQVMSCIAALEVPRE